ncbi:hypothetical protein GGD81_002843 [Rhodobium orientis]|uniref:DUF6456 domain-containing protein n=1 Tax=Rhodobium orientis TaxID=34017 RepID=A0A327JJM2_9HYPH|nr:DUF6456 domain-containing protein [Rhodobium orientis]MBB4303791.1 hypothetical protein [Rhodobium orientis]MBK5947909.1 hypothetical protein [Rhodobium orientis]RAI26075.1 hypothetical protein CH339_15540 [Rhodobium orientis]
MARLRTSGGNGSGRTKLLKRIAGGGCVLSETDGPDGQGSKTLDPDIWRPLVSDGLVVRGSDGAAALTDAGRAALKRALSGADGFGNQHRSLRTATILEEDGRRLRVTVNDTESPLAWLARRRGRDGKPYLSEAQVAAGERLRADFERGRMAPRVTANWSAMDLPADRRSGERGGIADLTDAALAARGRVAKALDAVGPELSGILIDVCCFLKGLEEVERARSWPARAGKVILAIALSRLDAHYARGASARHQKPVPRQHAILIAEE